MTTKKLTLSLLPLTVLLVSLGSGCGFRMFMPRQEVMNLLAKSGEGAEERLYMDRCSHSSKDGQCYRALDGDVFKEWTQCSGTKDEFEPQWTGHLETPSYISRIVIHTVDLPELEMVNALTHFELRVDDKTCYIHASDELFESMSFPCDSFGEEVKVVSKVARGTMALCEVEVYGLPAVFEGLEASPTELSLKSCDQASDASPEETCKNVMDRVFVQHSGVQGKSCARTEQEAKPWLVVYLDAPALVTNIKLFNRLDSGTDDMRHFNVMVGVKLCGIYKQGHGFDQLILSCDKFGSSVHVESQLENVHLTLCQVQVFGHRMVVGNLDMQFNYLGCFADSQEDPDLETLASGTWMTVRKCHKICKRKNKAKFGLQNGNVCFCGQKHGRYGESTNCTMACSDDNDSICGGRGANSVYEIL